MNRRKFLQLCGALTLAGTSGSLVCAVDGMASSLNGSPLYSTTRLAMGTFVSITIADAPQSLAEEAAGRAFEKIARLSNVFNEFDATTPLAVLNDQGRLSHAPGELAACLRHCAACNQLTDGAFDPTIKPVLDAFRKQGEQVDMSHLPTDLIGFGLVRMDGTNVTLSRDGMGLTLNGAAKGFIADRAGEVMERCGVTNYLLDAGGDIRARGSKSGRSSADPGTPWRVAITDPRHKGKRLTVLPLSNQCLATSGGYEVYFNTEKTHHHIIDPRTGDSPQHTLGASVQAADLTQADALATAAMVMAPRQSARCLREAGAKAWLVGRNGMVRV